MRALLLFLLGAALPAFSATLVVDSGADTALSDCTAAPADCTLRGAITSANATPANDRIEFAIPGSDPSYQVATDHWRILVGATALPPIEQEVVIDGYSQPGASANTQSPDEGGSNAQLKIELQPASPGTQNIGLDISLNFFAQPASVFRGLAISRFAFQIALNGSSAHRVEGCFLGTDVLGTQAAQSGDSGRGIRTFGPGPYVIGGLTPDTRNLISGMSSAIVFFTASDGARIQGNLIGTNATGTAAISNRDDAISSNSALTNARIGGTDPAARNIISASGFAALYLSQSGTPDPYAGTLIEGNYFGTDVSGRRALSNGLNPASPSQPQSTINLFAGGSCALTFGGTAPGQANLIAYGGAAGIQVASCRGVAIPFNRFVGNRGIAIDNSATSNADGATLNDAGDADEGGNRLQNSPVYSLPVVFLPSGGGSVEITASVDSALANSTYPLSIDVYRAGCGGGSAVWLGSFSIDQSLAQQPQTLTLSAPDGGNVLPLTMLARDAAGNTSEFAPVQGDALAAAGFEDVASPPTPGRCAQ